MPTLNTKKTDFPHLRKKPGADARPAVDYAFLNSGPWRALSKVYLRAHPVCECCKAAQREPLPPSEHCDHIVPRGAHGGAELDWANLAGLCKICHGIKTRMEAAGPLCPTVDTGSGFVPAVGGKLIVWEKINLRR